MPDRGNCGGDHDPTVTSKWAKGNGGPAGAETDNLVVERGGECGRPLAPTLNAHFGEKQGLEDQHINGGAGMFVLGAVPQDLRNREGKAGGGKGPLLSENQSLTLATNNDQVVFALQNPTLEKEQNGLEVSDGPMYTLESSRPHGIAFPLDLRNAGRNPEKHDAMNRQSTGTGGDGDPAPTVSSAFVHGVVAFDDRNQAVSSDAHHTLRVDGIGSRVSDFVAAQATLRPRRLTPTECERLQGFPDGHTNIPWKKGMAPEGPRYRALGNSMAVPVMAWIGKRIQCVEEANA